MAGKLVLLRLSLAGNQEKSPKGGSALGYEKYYRNTLQNNLRLTEQFTESQAGSWMPQQAVCRGLLEGFSLL
jgi:hypothetical protein